MDKSLYDILNDLYLCFLGGVTLSENVHWHRSSLFCISLQAFILDFDNHIYHYSKVELEDLYTFPFFFVHLFSHLMMLMVLQAYEEFVATFEETPVQKGKIWVKAGTFDAGSRSKFILEITT